MNRKDEYRPMKAYPDCYTAPPAQSSGEPREKSGPGPAPLLTGLAIILLLFCGVPALIGWLAYGTIQEAVGHGIGGLFVLFVMGVVFGIAR